MNKSRGRQSVKCKTNRRFPLLGRPTRATLPPVKPTPKQFAQLYERLGPSLRMLGRLRKRLEVRGYGGRDPYYLAACRAYDAVHALSTMTYSETVDMGVQADTPLRGQRDAT